jgi:hypothetical protein
MTDLLEFDKLMVKFQHQLEQLPDHRVGNNISYSIKDAALSAFSVFFTQSPSFLAHQRAMAKSKGRSNAGSLFQIEKIPSDNQIRSLLDPITPRHLYRVFDEILLALEQSGKLEPFRVLNGQLLVSMDGTSYFSSKAIHCPNCQHRTTAKGETTYYHTAITPVIVAPGRSQVISLVPEYIVPQDGHDKQDCERMAAKRWVKQQASQFKPESVTLLGDDLYSNQPLCQLILSHKFNFIFVCKPDSHQILYEWVNSLTASDDIDQVTLRRFNGRFTEIITCRFVEAVPLRTGKAALLVNWGEVTITHSQTGQQLYYNTFVTNHHLTEQTIVPIVEAGRARWKVENENNNVLKTNGYHLEHNFGHGQQYLSSFLLTLNLLAFLFHTVLELVDAQYRLLRQALGPRRTFFNDIKTLTRYLYFDSWHHLLDFMINQLELVPIFDTS